MHDDDTPLEWDSLPGSIADETDICFNNRLHTMMIVQRFWGASPDSVTLDEEQQLDLLFKLAERFGLTLS